MLYFWDLLIFAQSGMCVLTVGGTRNTTIPEGLMGSWSGLVDVRMKIYAHLME